MPTILSVRIDDVTPEEAADRCYALIEAGGTHQVATVNPEFVVAAQRDADFARALAGVDLAVPDGAGLLAAARWLGLSLRGRVTGVDLSWRLVALAAEHGYRLYLLGAGPGVAERAARAFAAVHPNLKIAGTFAGSPAIADEDAIVARIRAAAPHILLVAYGAPAQDTWIARNLSRLGAPLALAMGVGGVLDYVAGVVPYAPAWLRRLGLEWLYRLVRQPQRWRRMWNAVVVFPWLVLTHSRRGGAEEPSKPMHGGPDS